MKKKIALLFYLILLYSTAWSEVVIENVRAEQLGAGALIKYDLFGEMTDDDEIILKVNVKRVSQNARSFLGVTSEIRGSSIDKMLGKSFGYSRDQTNFDGVYINKVTPGSAADKYGLQIGDIIVQMDNSKILDKGLSYYMTEFNAYDEVDIKIIRLNKENYKKRNRRGYYGYEYNGDYITIKVKLDPHPSDTEIIEVSASEIGDITGDIGKYIHERKNREIYFWGINNSDYYTGDLSVEFSVLNKKSFNKKVPYSGQEYELTLTPTGSSTWNAFSEGTILPIKIFPNEAFELGNIRLKKYFDHPRKGSSTTYKDCASHWNISCSQVYPSKRNGAWHLIDDKKIKNYYSADSDKELFIFKARFPDHRQISTYSEEPDEYMLTLIGASDDYGNISGLWEIYIFAYPKLNKKSLGGEPFSRYQSLSERHMNELKSVKPKFGSKSGSGARCESVAQSGTFTLTGATSTNLLSVASTDLINLSVFAKKRNSSLFMTRGEFESREEYRMRIAEQREVIYSLIQESTSDAIERKKEDIRLAEERVHKAEIDKQNKITQSLESVEFDITEIVGNYDIDNEQFTIKVNGKQYNISVPRRVAGEFKNKLANTKVKGYKKYNDNLVYEYFNFSVNHPVTEETYFFGPTKDVAELKGVALIITDRKFIPPELSMLVVWTEPNGNNFLDAEETGILKVSITNSGEGSAMGVHVDLNVLGDINDQLNYDSDKYLAREIKPGATESVEFKIQASKNVKRQKNVFLIEATESYRHPPDPQKLTFETYPLILPKIEMIEYAMAQNGINITLQVKVQNTGQGVAENVVFTLNLLDKNSYFEPRSKTSYTFKNLAPGEYKDLSFDVNINKMFDNDILELSIGFTEENTSGKFPFEIPVDIEVIAIKEQVIAGQEAEKINIKVSSLKIDVEQDIPITDRDGKNDLAIIFGIEKYAELPSVSYAERDAKFMREYFNKTLGIPIDRMLYRINNKVSLSQFKKLKSWLKNRIQDDIETNIYFYYAGHGSPSKNKKAYLLPADGDPNYIEDTGVEISSLYEDLSSLGAKSVTVFLDACFSGANRQTDEQLEMILADARPVFIETEKVINNKINIFAAAQGNQVSSAWPEKKHGLFSYFLMKGLKGKADKNKDKKITYDELGKYIRKEVKRQSGMLDREQDPTFNFQDNSKIFIKY